MTIPRPMGDPQFLRWVADQIEGDAAERLRDIALKLEEIEDAGMEADLQE